MAGPFAGLNRPGRSDIVTGFGDQSMACLPASIPDPAFPTSSACHQNVRIASRGCSSARSFTGLVCDPR